MSADQLLNSNRGSLPSDQRFRELFSRATVSKNYLARFYLRSIESFNRDGREFRINRHHDEVNLEHILPRHPGEHWEQFSEEDFANYHKRLGNLTVIDRGLNTAAANASFEEKKQVYAESEIEMTRSIADVEDWTTQSIEDRQMALAETAVQVWAVSPMRG